MKAHIQLIDISGGPLSASVFVNGARAGSVVESYEDGRRYFMWEDTEAAELIQDYLVEPEGVLIDRLLREPENATWLSKPTMAEWEFRTNEILIAIQQGIERGVIFVFDWETKKCHESPHDISVCENGDALQITINQHGGDADGE